MVTQKKKKKKKRERAPKKEAVRRPKVGIQNMIVAKGNSKEKGKNAEVRKSREVSKDGERTDEPSSVGEDQHVPRGCKVRRLRNRNRAPR